MNRMSSIEWFFHFSLSHVSSHNEFPHSLTHFQSFRGAPLATFYGGQPNLAFLSLLIESIYMKLTLNSFSSSSPLVSCVAMLSRCKSKSDQRKERKSEEFEMKTRRRDIIKHHNNNEIDDQILLWIITHAMKCHSMCDRELEIWSRNGSVRSRCEVCVNADKCERQKKRGGATCETGLHAKWMNLHSTALLWLSSLMPSHAELQHPHTISHILCTVLLNFTTETTSICIYACVSVSVYACGRPSIYESYFCSCPCKCNKTKREKQ